MAPLLPCVWFLKSPRNFGTAKHPRLWLLGLMYEPKLLIDISTFSDGVAPAQQWRPSCLSLQTIARSLAGCSWWGAALSPTPATGSPGRSLSTSAARASICKTGQTQCRASSARAVSRWTHLWCPHASVSLIRPLILWNAYFVWQLWSVRTRLK